MFRQPEERFVLGSKENLTENMESFSLKVQYYKVSRFIIS